MKLYRKEDLTNGTVTFIPIEEEETETTKRIPVEGDWIRINKEPPFWTGLLMNKCPLTDNLIYPLTIQITKIVKIEKKLGNSPCYHTFTEGKYGWIWNEDRMTILSDAEIKAHLFEKDGFDRTKPFYFKGKAFNIERTELSSGKTRLLYYLQNIMNGFVAYDLTQQKPKFHKHEKVFAFEGQDINSITDIVFSPDCSKYSYYVVNKGWVDEDKLTGFRKPKKGDIFRRKYAEAQRKYEYAFFINDKHNIYLSNDLKTIVSFDFESFDDVQKYPENFEYLGQFHQVFGKIFTAK